MIDLKTFEWQNAVLLAPMEDISDLAYREICREMGAELVFTEFVNSDGLLRGCKRGRAKMRLSQKERPAGVQIYGNDTEAMVHSAVLAMEEAPDLIDINAGCWVKKVSSRGAGAGLLKDPAFMQRLIGEVVRAVPAPVTVKTRIGWDAETINILEIAQRLEDVGVRALTVHCRTRSQGHAGEPDWEWIARIKDRVSMPIVVNGGIFTAEDAQRAFTQTGADGVMIARGAIGMPWVFREIRAFLETGEIPLPPSFPERVEIALRHLRGSIESKGERLAIPAFRKYYRGYFNGIPHISPLRMALMKQDSYEGVANMLHDFIEKGFVSAENLDEGSKNMVDEGAKNMANHDAENPQSIKKDEIMI